MAPKSQSCRTVGNFQHADNRRAALTGAIELIRRPSSDNVIIAVLKPVISPLPNLEQELGGSTLSKGAYSNNLLTLQLCFPDIQLIGLAVQWKLNFLINFKPVYRDVC